MLTPAAASALLKTLEEPPGHVVFVLATTDPQKVLPTIRSRTQHFEFRLLRRRRARRPRCPRRRRARPASTWRPRPSTWSCGAGHGSARDALSALDQVAAAGGVDRRRRPSVDELVDGLADRDTGRGPWWRVADGDGAGPRRPAAGRRRCSSSCATASSPPMARTLVHAPRRGRWHRVEEQARRLGPAGAGAGHGAGGRGPGGHARRARPPRHPRGGPVRLARPGSDAQPGGPPGAPGAPRAARGRSGSSGWTRANLQSGPFHRPWARNRDGLAGRRRLSSSPAHSRPSGRPPAGPGRPTRSLRPHLRLTSYPARLRLRSIRASRRRRRPTSRRPNRRRPTRGRPSRAGPAVAGPAAAGPARPRRQYRPVAEPRGPDHRLGRRHLARVAPGGEGLRVRRPLRWRRRRGHLRPARQGPAVARRAQPGRGRGGPGGAFRPARAPPAGAGRARHPGGPTRAAPGQPERGRPRRAGRRPGGATLAGATPAGSVSGAEEVSP